MCVYLVFLRIHRNWGNQFRHSFKCQSTGSISWVLLRGAAGPWGTKNGSLLVLEGASFLKDAQSAHTHAQCTHRVHRAHTDTQIISMNIYTHANTQRTQSAYIHTQGTHTQCMHIHMHTQITHIHTHTQKYTYIHKAHAVKHRHRLWKVLRWSFDYHSLRSYSLTQCQALWLKVFLHLP